MSNDRGPSRASLALEGRQLTRTYRQSKTLHVEALRGVDVRIRRGEAVAVVGASGCGKSTLLNVLGTLDRPTAGAVLIDGQDTSGMSDDDLARMRNRRVGFVFQDFSLITRMSASNNVQLPLVAADVASAERQRRADEALAAVGLEGLGDRRPMQLSGGQQQRVSIARALVTDPAIVLADEPTGALDSRTSAELVDLLIQLNEEGGVTLLIVTHDMDVAARMQRTITMRDGLVVPEVVA